MFYQIAVEGKKEDKKKAIELLNENGHFVSGTNGNWIIRGIGAKLLERKEGISFEIHSTIRLSEQRICQFPNFVNFILSAILKELECEAQEKATVVLGVGQLGRILAYSAADHIYKARCIRVHNSFVMKNGPSCRVVYARPRKLPAFLGSKLVVEKGFSIKPEDKLIFVHCDFDKPLSVNIEEMLSFAFTRRIREPEGHLKKILKQTGGEVLQSIVHPIPYKEYEEFLENPHQQ